ncbi:MAG: DHH family phosphoesterase [Clostridia bacterium]|nr:DHH family phosphoesterase [Clostridia bacterium]
MRKPPIFITVLFACTTLLGCAALAKDVRPLYGLLAAVAVIALLLLALGQGIRYRKEAQALYDDVFRDNQSAAGSVISRVDIPACIFDANGRILWENKALRAMYAGKDIKQTLPNIELPIPQKTLITERNGRSFTVTNMHVKRRNAKMRPLTFQYWIDRTEALHYSRLYEEQMPTVAIISVDNYEDLAANEQFRRNSVLTEVEKQVKEFVQGVEGVYRRYENAKFYVLFEAKRLAELEKKRFPLLDSVRGIDTGTNQSVTLSIAIGAAERMNASDEAARESMELALGRGGDQAVVKKGSNFVFYGGNKMVTTRYSRVKIRLFARALRQLIENTDQVFVMGHKNSDMDCVGAALGVMRCANHVNCKFAYMVLDAPNITIRAALDTMRANKIYHERILTPEQAHAIMRPDAVMVVVDTQRSTTVMDKSLYERAGKTVIIDHHRRPVDALANPTLSYMEAGASSVCEIVTEVIQYFDDNVKPTTFECGALLTGITLDTKRFVFNVGARTFEAASYLKRSGADNSAVKMMFQDDMAVYRERTRVVQSALIMEKGIAISTCPDGMSDAQLIAAQAADELITIRDISAAFVLSNINGVVMISGRSTGVISVQLILEKLGGGGHMTVAGAQLRNVTIDEAIEQLTAAIQSYLQEADIK